MARSNRKEAKGKREEETVKTKWNDAENRSESKEYRREQKLSPQNVADKEIEEGQEGRGHGEG